jgi:hypothetical protein
MKLYDVSNNMLLYLLIIYLKNLMKIYLFSKKYKPYSLYGGTINFCFEYDAIVEVSHYFYYSLPNKLSQRSCSKLLLIT